MLEQQLAGFRRNGAAPIAGQQVLAQLHFQQADLAAQRRLGNVQRNGGAREAAEFGHAHEIFKLLEVHDGEGWRVVL